MKKSKRIAIIALILVVIMSGCNAKKSKADGSGEKKEPGEKHHVEIHIKEYGTIYAELDTTYAPISVKNFMDLSKEGFYDGLTFHRIIKDFMIQGGSVDQKGMQGSDKKIKGEFEKNGVENPNTHTRGAISMARAKDPDSASSQFFIVHKDSPHLDGEYAVFGYVTDGMDIVDQICEEVESEAGSGSVELENQPIIEQIKVID